jgi:hypothetical protein
MSRMRLVIAALTAVVLAVLIGWQVQRERLVRACLHAGGTWHGPVSICRSPRPILQRDLQRS